MAKLSLDPAPILETTDSGLLRFRDNVQLNYNKIQDIVNSLDSENIRDGSISAQDLAVPVTLGMYGNAAVLAGGGFVSGDIFKLQTGSAVSGTDVAGDVTIAFPNAYATGLGSIVVCMGADTVTVANPMIRVTALNQFIVRVFNTTTGAAIVSSGLMRFNWFALGW